jgi:5'-nucleotidase
MRLLRRFLLLIAILQSLPSVALAAPKTVDITVLQLNDVYQISPVDKGRRGGLARVATLVRKIRAASPHTLFLLAGDTISPSVASKIFKGAQMIAVWNALGLDYATFGNHEFDFGDDVLRARIKQSRFGWLAANVVEKASGKPFPGSLPYAIRSVGGVKVGIIGLTTPETEKASKPGPDLEFEKIVPVARRVVAQMRKNGAQVIIGLTHESMRDDKRLAHEVPIDLICGGHEHIVLESMVGPTPIFKVASDAVNLGRIDLHYSLDTRRIASIDFALIPVTAEVPDDPAVKAVVERYEHELSKELDKPVGRSAVELDARAATNRTAETNLGDFITDAYRAYAKSDVAITNGGSIRTNEVHDPGVLTRKDVLAILPFENPIVKVSLKGSVLREAIEHGLAHAGDPDNGAFPQISGMRVVYDAARPAGHRIVSIEVGGKPLDDLRTYTLATNTFLLKGGDGYTMFVGHVRYLIEPEEGQVEPAVVMAAIGAVPEIAPRIEGRMRPVK